MAKRSKKFVDKRVQGSLVCRLVVHWFAFLIVGTGVALMLQFLSDPFRSVSEHFGLLLQRQAGFLLVMVCMTPVFLLDTVKLTNRFAGPVLRLRRAMNELANGQDVAPIKFRPGDYWTELADEFNRILERVPKSGAADDAGEPTEPEREVKEEGLEVAASV